MTDSIRGDRDRLPSDDSQLRLPQAAQLIIDATVPLNVRDAVIGDFEEQFRSRCAHSTRAAILWLFRETVISLALWTRYWFTKRGSIRVYMAVLVGLVVTATGLLLVVNEPALSSIEVLPRGWIRPVGWSAEGALVVIAAYLTSRVGRDRAVQAVSWLVAPLLLLPVWRYSTSWGERGMPWLLSKAALVAACVVIGTLLACSLHRRLPFDQVTRH